MPTNRPTMADNLPGHIDNLARLSGRTTDWAWFDTVATKLDEQDARLKSGEKIPKEELLTKRQAYEAMGTTATTFDKFLTLRRFWRLQQQGRK